MLGKVSSCFNEELLLILNNSRLCKSSTKLKKKVDFIRYLLEESQILLLFDEKIVIQLDSFDNNIIIHLNTQHSFKGIVRLFNFFLPYGT